MKNLCISGNQVICLSDTSPFTMSIRLDKNAAEICHLAKIKVHYGGPNDEFKLVEVKSNGGEANSFR